MLPGNSFDEKSSNAVVAKKLGPVSPPDLSTSENAAGSILISQAHTHAYGGVTEFHLRFNEESSEQELTFTGNVSSDA